ncbi:phage tail protein [Edwardsiella tarda]|uniref:phage tail protein n=1 Tax=Edwardsiella tarda TaxID=636 RepID=UPI00083B4D87|nr:phage tail protein [Edwardsiella tarda]
MAHIEKERLEAVLRELSDSAVPTAIRRASKIVGKMAIERAAERVSRQQSLPVETVKKRMRLYTPRGGSSAYSKITVYRSDMPLINWGAPILILGPRDSKHVGWRGSVLTVGGKAYPGMFLRYLTKYGHWQVMEKTGVPIEPGKRKQHIRVSKMPMGAVLTQAFEQEKNTILSGMEREVNKQLSIQLKREMRK